MSAVARTRTARPARPDQARPARGGRRRERADATLFGVPERFMRPRLVLLAIVAALVGFGLLMVYSASSPTALNTTGDAAYYLKRQALFAAVGVAIAFVLAKVDYHVWVRQLLLPVWVATVGLLVVVLVAGTDNDMGASRWIDLGFFDLQPSEFAKLTVVFTAAALAERYFEEGALDLGSFIRLLAIGVGLPILLIILQPDKGTVLVLGLTIVVMGYLAGIPRGVLGVVLALGVAGFLGLSLASSYSRQRLLTMLNPWADPYHDGWQLIQGFYAFGSGGLFGVGLGMSREKYSYLPMAHNDFIFAVIGEEFGLVGTIGLLAGFAVFMWAGLRIARYAPDLAGRLVAAGCTSLVIVQLLLNVSGVLGIFPMSGKPIPFVSYGGSSIIASLMLVGMVASVSIHSRLPETASDRARRSWRVEEADGGAPGGPGGRPGLSFVGEPEPRSARAGGAGRDAGAGRSAGRSTPLTVVDGGARGGRDRGRERPARGRVTTDASGRRRIDLGPSASERLRGRDDGPRVRR